MRIDIQLTESAIVRPPPVKDGAIGAWVEFLGIVRAKENERTIAGLEYEVYLPMAERLMRAILCDLNSKWPCHRATVIHRFGMIPVGEPAIFVGVGASHRREALELLTAFMDRLKQDVPIWKRETLTGGQGRPFP